MKYRKGVFLVVYKKEHEKINYLILKRKLHWKGWEFPKGGRAKGETIKQTILRELKEETALKPLKLKNHKIAGKYPYNQKLDDRIETGQTFKLYSVEVKKGKIKIDKREHSAYKWVLFNEAIKKLTWANQKKCLGVVEKSLNKR